MSCYVSWSSGVYWSEADQPKAFGIAGRLLTHTSSSRGSIIIRGAWLGSGHPLPHLHPHIGLLHPIGANGVLIYALFVRDFFLSFILSIEAGVPADLCSPSSSSCKGI